MATLYEIGLEYERSADQLRQRLKELRSAYTASNDTEERWRIKRRIKELTPLLTQCNKLAKYCKRYYERGYYIGNGAFTTECKYGASEKEKLRTLPQVGTHIEGTANAKTNGVCKGMSFEWSNVYGLSKRKRRKQEHCFSGVLCGVEKTS